MTTLCVFLVSFLTYLFDFIYIDISFWYMVLFEGKYLLLAELESQTEF